MKKIGFIIGGLVVTLLLFIALFINGFNGMINVTSNDDMTSRDLEISEQKINNVIDDLRQQERFTHDKADNTSGQDSKKYGISLALQAQVDIPQGLDNPKNHIAITDEEAQQIELLLRDRINEMKNAEKYN